MWTGIISRAQAEHIGRAASAAGGFVAVDLPLESGGYLAALPWDGEQKGNALPRAELRAFLVEQNRLQGWEESRIGKLLAIIDEQG